ncbi:DUF5919 domain-containing protein [Nocardia sp. NPDC048505]|uniref:DUF5919 domain-containing protein n=1 Tax=Nocardia sp. NPDC048505 TaxID=3155756 RepID=UPI0034061A82
MGTVLKALLQQRHLQTVAAFNRHYDHLAEQIEPGSVGAGPRKAQFYRWLSGDLVGLPYPHHCRILTAMFPGWAINELFAPYTDLQSLEENHCRSTTLPQPTTADVEAVFPTRTEFIQSMPPTEILRANHRIDAMGLSLNLLCQHLSDSAVRGLVESGTTLRCLFLDPGGVHIRNREAEEGHEPGVLVNLTELNIRSLERIRRGATPDAAARIELRTYDQPVRFNITVVDSEVCIVQPYLPACRDVESPTFVCRKSPAAGVFDCFSGVFASMWENGNTVEKR